MGKYILLITFASVLAISYFGQRSQQNASADDINERQREVIARQIAQSAFNKGVSEVRRNFGSISGGTRKGSYEQGTYLLEFSTSFSGEKTVSIRAEGTFDGKTYQISGQAEKDTTVSAFLNAITSSTPIDFSVAGGGCSGHPCVSGIDVAGNVDRHGISLPYDSDTGTDEVCAEFDGDVDGMGGKCSVAERSEKREEWVQSKMDDLESEILSEKDSGSDDVVTCPEGEKCKMKDFPTNSGVLYVEGDLVINGDEQWNGPVFADDSSSVRINGGGDTKNINGALVMSDSTNFKDDEEFNLNGGNSVRFNSENILEYMDLLPSSMATKVTVQDRSGRFLAASE